MKDQINQTQNKFSDEYEVIQRVGDYQIWKVKDADPESFDVAELNRNTGEMIIQVKGFLNAEEALDWIYDYGKV